MGKKKKKLKARSGGGSVNVVEIMKGIEEKARERSISDDIARVSAIDLRKISLDEGEIESLRSTFVNGGKEEHLSENLTYINQNYSLTDKYNFVTTHRKGFVGKMINRVLSKLFLAMKIFLDRVVVAQEIFNVKVVRLFNRISKDLERIDEANKSLENDLAYKIDNQIDENRIAFEEKIVDLDTKITNQVDSLEKQVEQIKKDIVSTKLCSNCTKNLMVVREKESL